MNEKLKCPLVFGQTNTDDPTQYDCIEGDCKFWAKFGNHHECMLVVYLGCSITNFTDDISLDFDTENDD